MNDAMLGAAQVRDPSITQLMATAQSAAVFERDNNDWVRKFDGSFMLFNRDATPQYGFIVLDRNRPDFLIELFGEGSTVQFERTSETDQSNALLYTNVTGNLEYLLAFESVDVAQRIFQKLKQAIILVSSSHGNESRWKHRKSIDAAANGHDERSQLDAGGKVGVAAGKSNLLSQLMTAKANFTAAQSSKPPSKKQSRETNGEKRGKRTSAAADVNLGVPVRSSNAGSYYAKPSVNNVSLNGVKSEKAVLVAVSNGPLRAEDLERNSQIARTDANDSISKKTESRVPITLTQLFGKGNVINPVADSSSKAAPPASAHYEGDGDAPHIACNTCNGDTASSQSNQNSNCASEEDELELSSNYFVPRSLRLGSESDSQLIAPHAFVAQSDENRKLLDLVILEKENGSARPGRGNETDSHVEVGHSGTENCNGICSPGDGHRTSHTSSSADAGTARRRISRRARQSREKPLPTLNVAQLRTAFIDLLENDDNFVDELHKNYTRLLMRPAAQTKHQ